MCDQGFQTLPLDLPSAVRAGRLPGPHRDPFDRLIVAQAIMQTLTYTVRIEPAEGGYDVHVPALPGCAAQGATYEEGVAMAQEPIESFVEALALAPSPRPPSPNPSSRRQLTCASR